MAWMRPDWQSGKVASYIWRATQGRGLNWLAAIAEDLVDVSSLRSSIMECVGTTTL